MEPCKNCGTLFEGSFCPNCGQKRNSGRIVLKESFNDVLEHYFDFNTPLFRTVTGLISNPGKLIRDYIFGKRKSFAHPVRFYVLSLALYLIIRTLIDFNPIETFSEMIQAKEAPNPDTVSTKASNYFSSHINSFMLIYAFTLSFMSRLFFRKDRLFFVEHFTMALYIVSEYVLLAIVTMLLSGISPYFFLLNYVIVFLYPVYVLVRFHSGKTWVKIIKAMCANAVAWVLYAMLGFALAYFIVLTFDL